MTAPGVCASRAAADLPRGHGLGVLRLQPVEPVRPAPFTTTVVEIYPDREPSEDLVTVSK
jgi:hypothetical protein